MSIRNFARAALLGVAAIGLPAAPPACRPRSLAIRPPSHRDRRFYVVPGPGVQQGLQFNAFAAQVAQQMEAKGYRWPAAPDVADMLVQLATTLTRAPRNIPSIR